jgi:hypothetical protein
MTQTDQNASETIISNIMQDLMKETSENTQSPPIDTPLIIETQNEVLQRELATPQQQNATKGSKRVTIVTSCSSHYFVRLRNFIGSVHYWEPKLKVTALFL